MNLRTLMVALIALASTTACRSTRRSPERVQSSSPAARDTDVKIDSSFNFAPSCTVIREGQTVEWWVGDAKNEIPVNVTSIGGTGELFSPNLVTPLSCAQDQPDRICWRHTFSHPGCFPYYDSNSGSPGRPVVDDYYGTTTFVGVDGVQTAVVCVEGAGVSCSGVCCTSNFDCHTGFSCKLGRCVASDGTQSLCPAKEM